MAVRKPDADAASGTQDLLIRVCGVSELVQQGMRVVSAGGRVILVAFHEGRVYALDNRCPHMGFPLSRGTVNDGILTCHWHHARFDLASGCTFDPFADDVASFSVEVRGEDVWLNPTPVEEDRAEHWRRKLREGLEQDIRLVLAKSVIGLSALDETTAVIEHAALFGVTHRAGGWSTGLSILSAIANVLPVLADDDRPRGLYKGLIHVADSTAGQAPNFSLAPLVAAERRPELYGAWFRRFVDVRSGEAAERCLRTAIRNSPDHTSAVAMILAACTDHRYIDEGHTLDFANKAFELLDRIGWQHAEDVLPSLVPSLVGATRMEETASWRHPVDLGSLFDDADQELNEALTRGAERNHEWAGHRELAEVILDAEPQRLLEALLEVVRSGTRLVDLSATVAYAAARRAVHFHTSNEFGDWDTLHHVFTYANSVDQAMRRLPSRELARGILDGALAVYLERFLNVPKQPLPSALALPAGSMPTSAQLLSAFDRQQNIDEAAEIAAAMLGGGEQESLVRALGHALLREDAGFHQFQIYEAAVQQARNFTGRPEAAHILIGATRFLAAHSPTVRASEQTFDIAARLLRGESLHGEEA